MSGAPTTRAAKLGWLVGLVVACGGQVALKQGPACETPTQITDDNGVPTGFQDCDGAINRAEAISADPSFPGDSCHGDEDDMLCDGASDCTIDGHGDCQHGEYRFSDYSWCACAYSCSDDSECGVGEACVHYAVSDDLDWSQCVPADCITGADCKSGECGLSEWEDDCERSNDVKLACRHDGDECRTDADCFTGLQCVAGGEKWVCRRQNVCR